jgi:CMP-N-acetylneuraminic acid synthetase
MLSTMTVVGFVPSKLNSQRLPQKNIRELGGTPLINHVLRTLEAVEAVDEVIVYASDDAVMASVEPDTGARFVPRPAALDTDAATVQDFVGGFLRDVEADVVVLLHATSPFISVETVSRCIDEVVSGRHESAFAALEIQRFAWFEGRPLNYSLDRPTPRTQDLAPVLVEQSGLYVFTRDLFERTGRRIADDPYICVIGAEEGHDIDTLDEFEMAERLIEARGAGR